MSDDKTLIFGAGWIGTKFHQQIPQSVLSKVDITDQKAIEEEINRVQPDCIINCAGKTGRPNIDSCEKEPQETLRVNLAGPILLATEAHKRDIHFVHMSSGCIYTGDNGGKGFSEDSPPNFLGSVYSRSKALAESALRDFNALQLRIRMPISSEPGPRNLVTKLVNYRQVIRAPNSITILEDFFPCALKLISEKKTGVFNIVNEGIEYHDELLELYKTIVDSNFRYEVIPFETLKEKLNAPRSNCILNTEKLRLADAQLPSLHDSLKIILKNYAENMK